MVRQLSDALEWPLVFCLCVALGACSAKLPHTKQSESTPVELAEEWFACTVDADCKVILDATCTFVSINVAHEADVQNWIERELARTIFGRCRGRELNYEAICSIDRCSASRLTQ